MLTIAKKNMMDLSSWLSTELGFISGIARYNEEPIELEPYQVDFLLEPSRFRWVTKARQVGYSFIFALEALARCHLRNGYTAVFVSYNLEDAKEKILIARQVYDELPLAFQKRLVADSKTELIFEGGGHISRIISAPSKPPRGKKGDLYLDELAHYLNDHEVYSGSTALILRTHGQLTGASTPLGRRGIFWEIAEQELRKYPHHSRQVVPWWHCSLFCENVEQAKNDAPAMMTADRVNAFGKENIQEQFASLSLDDFQQEFETMFVDESYSFYPYELILPCTSERLKLYADFQNIPRPEGRLVAGFDVGRTRDSSELALFEERDGKFVCRMLRGFRQVPFADQEGELRQMLDLLPIARLSIDKSGIGMNLAENLARDYPQVKEEVFTNESKERWATDFKILLQRQNVTLPRDRDLVGQVHSIKRSVTAAGRVVFDSERLGMGHADRFWAVALACQKERNSGGERADIRVTILG